MINCCYEKLLTIAWFWYRSTFVAEAVEPLRTCDKTTTWFSYAPVERRGAFWLCKQPAGRQAGGRAGRQADRQACGHACRDRQAGTQKHT